MQEYYFLFGLGLVFSLFAVVQDLKSREISNWLNFSLLAFALAYRAFYALETKNINFFLIGLITTTAFFFLGFVFYYSKIFAGGDAKLLIAYGAILPIERIDELFIKSLFFIFLLFFVGSIYGLIYSVFIVKKNIKKFKREFIYFVGKSKYLFFVFGISLVILAFLFRGKDYLFLLVLLSLMPLIYIYAKALDRCMLKRVPYYALTEGDWLERDIRVSKNVIIKKTVHGLSASDIKLLKKYKKFALIKEGIPFSPAFLFAFLIMVFFFLKQLSLENFFYLFFS